MGSGASTRCHPHRQWVTSSGPLKRHVAIPSQTWRLCCRSTIRRPHILLVRRPTKREPRAVTELQELLDTKGPDAASKQRVSWSYDAWRRLSDHRRHGSIAVATVETLEDRWAVDLGITRDAVLQASAGHPIRLLVASMIWGLGTIQYGPTRVLRMLDAPTSKRSRKTSSSVHGSRRRSASRRCFTTIDLGSPSSVSRWGPSTCTSRTAAHLQHLPARLSMTSTSTGH